jgi:hypothetical protein
LRYDVVVRGLFYLAVLAGSGAIALTLFYAARSSRLGVCVPVVLLAVGYVLVVFNLLPGNLSSKQPYFLLSNGYTGVLSFISAEAAGIALVGCLLMLATMARDRRWSLLLSLMMLVLVLVASLGLPSARGSSGVLQVPVMGSIVGTYWAFVAALEASGFLSWAAPVLVPLIYGLWRYRTGAAANSVESTRRANIGFTLATVATVGLVASAMLAFGQGQEGTSQAIVVGISVSCRYQCDRGWSIWGVCVGCGAQAVLGMARGSGSVQRPGAAV